jgi:hypothetical protein
MGKWDYVPTRYGGGTPAADFCIVITSIGNNEVQGFYSYTPQGGGLPGAFTPIKGKVKSSSSSTTIVAKAAEKEIVLKFQSGGRVEATLMGLFPSAGSFQVNARVTKFH